MIGTSTEAAPLPRTGCPRETALPPLAPPVRTLERTRGGACGAGRHRGVSPGDAGGRLRGRDERASAAQIVSQSAARTATVKSFHVVVSVEHVPTPAKDMSVTFLEGDLVVPDRLHAHISGTLQGIPLTSEPIIVGTKHLLRPVHRLWGA